MYTVQCFVKYQLFFSLDILLYIYIYECGFTFFPLHTNSSKTFIYIFIMQYNYYFPSHANLSHVISLKKHSKK